MKNIRNFSIIAHIDHGKSTLADRFLEITGLTNDRTKRAQFLDKMDIERERGITIKAQTVRLPYKKDGQDYILNLIDTPGHVDFSYEVSRSLKACEGVLLVVDATQGVEAQTLANLYMAVENNLAIIPVINKIDLPNSDPEKVKGEIVEVTGCSPDEIIQVSAKTGQGMDEIFNRIIDVIPPPKGSPDNELKALIFDSWFDAYRGGVALIRIFEGSIEKGQKLYLMHHGKTYEALEIGYFSPEAIETTKLGVGEVGYLVAGIKNIRDIKIGDTVTDFKRKTPHALPGFKELKPMVFSSIFPVDSNKYEDLCEAIEKLSINDSSFTYEKETSTALGFGFRVGYLGILHMEIVRERLEREYNLDLIITAPAVIYRVILLNGKIMEIDNPAKLPDIQHIAKIEEPIYKVTIHTPAEFVGVILKLCEERRGAQQAMNYLSSNRVIIEYHLPMNEIIMEFYDKLKTISRGYATMDYEFLEFKEDKLVKLDIMINGNPVDALSAIVHKDKAYYKGRELTKRMREVIPRQMFEVIIQSKIGSKVISRDTVKPFRKNVTAKCYGGDISRKRKLLEKQKEGKKRMKNIGNVEIPQEAFLEILKID